MKILIAGSHGMIGSAVTCHLIGCGHEVIRLVRQTPGLGEVWWDPDAGKIDAVWSRWLQRRRQSRDHALAFPLDPKSERKDPRQSYCDLPPVGGFIGSVCR